MKCLININSKIVNSFDEKAIGHAVKILRRDIESSFYPSQQKGASIILKRDENLSAEEYAISIKEDIVIAASEELGFVYGLLYISENYLGIKPFWYWMDQEIQRKDDIAVDFAEIKSQKPIVRFRGWFINDEVLIMRWTPNQDSEEPWRMAFEALLRCGGNMVIPGTDKNSHIYRRLASDMGLWITHHHVEPLGAEMFARKYPDLNANYFEHSEKFHKLWLESIKAHKGMKVIWTLGFRGQGDSPFWDSDNSGMFDTDEKRGRLISEIIEQQRQMIMENVENPVFCTNLYGEIMELYDKGFVSFSDDIIKISADNGFGKMVTRRRWNETKRIPSLPKSIAKHWGIYYHVSFYDLQAANHITMLPNSVDFVNAELNKVIQLNVKDFWLVNCSNIRPHTYFLDALRRKWYGKELSDAVQSEDFSKDYFASSKAVAESLRDYSKAMVSFGTEEDEHAGEQFYNENVRTLSSRFMTNQDGNASELRWLTGKDELKENARIFGSLCSNSLENLRLYYEECKKVLEGLDGKIGNLYKGTILLQSEIHYFCCLGVCSFCKALDYAYEKKYLDSFMMLGKTAEMFDYANSRMRESEYEKWKGFYANECFADIKYTAYMVRKLMGYIRELGEGPVNVSWYRLAMYAPEDRNICSLFVNDNHLHDIELYERLKKYINLQEM